VPQLAVVGNLARDRIDSGPPQPGGCPFFAALALRMLGSEGQIVTRCADADLPLFRPAVDALGVPVTLLPAADTSAFDHFYEGETRATTVTGIGDPWAPADASHVDAGVDWVHVAPLLRSDFPPETLAALADGRRLSLDAQGLVRVPRLGPLVQDAGYDAAVLDSVSVLKLSEEEASIVAGGVFDDATAARLGVPEILVTFGSRGETVYADGVATRVPTSPVTGVETTGAGDAFMVGYIAARSEGLPPVEAAHRASRLVVEMLEERKPRG
jgi:sugar/nucleoside kinase (ribokinase family)